MWHFVSYGHSCPCKVTLFLSIQYLALGSIGWIFKIFVKQASMLYLDYHE